MARSRLLAGCRGWLDPWGRYRTIRLMIECTPRKNPLSRWGSKKPGASRRRAMTLVEMAIVVIVVSAGLFLLVGWMGNLREDAKHDLAVRLLADLDRALARYHRATGCYPTSYGQHSAIEATDDLLGHERTRSILKALPACLWRGSGQQTLVDPWVTGLQYFGANSNSEYVLANGGRPVFVSAGPDRTFGFQEEDPAFLGDNLRSDDPGTDGFRLHHVMREALSESEEQSYGEEDD